MRRLLQFILMLLGVASFALIALQCTAIPSRLYFAMGEGGPPIGGEPDYIVVLGGGGIPSESGLMRSYQAAEVARRFVNAGVVVAMTDSNDLSTARMMDELVLRGVKRERIVLEDRGRNTREQALNLRKMLYADGQQPVVLVVTSTEHMRRALLSMRKAGFDQASGSPAESVSLTASLSYESSEMGPKPALMPDVGDNLNVRYRFWSNLELTARCLRELAALAYYKLMGWI